MFARFREKTPTQQMLEIGLLTLGIGLLFASVFFFTRGETKAQAKARRDREEARKAALPELERRHELSRFMVEELGYTHDKKSFADLTLYGGKLDRTPFITDDGLRAQWFLGSVVDFAKGRLQMWGNPGDSRQHIVDAMETELNISTISYPRTFREGGKRVLRQAPSLTFNNVQEPAQSKREIIDDYEWEVNVFDERPTPQFETYTELINYRPTGPEQWRICLYWWPKRKL